MMFGISPSNKQRRDQASRAISTARLKRSRALHLPPINLVLSQGPSGVLRLGSVHLGEGFPLRCIQRLSPRDIAFRRESVPRRILVPASPACETTGSPSSSLPPAHV